MTTETQKKVWIQIPVGIKHTLSGSTLNKITLEVTEEFADHLVREKIICRGDISE